MAAEELWTVEALFCRSPRQLELFHHAAAEIEAQGAVECRVTRSQVSLCAGRQFAWLWPPREWAQNRPRGCIVLSFALGRQVVDQHIVQAVQPYPDRWMQHIILQQAADQDGQVHGWLQEAYAFGLYRR